MMRRKEVPATDADFNDSSRADIANLPEEDRAHPLVMVDGVLRFKADPLILWLTDFRLSNGRRSHVDLNELGTMVGSGEFTEDDRRRFYRNMGYSLDGYFEIFCDTLCPSEAEAEEDNERDAS